MKKKAKKMCHGGNYADGGTVTLPKPTGTNTTGATKLGQGWTKAGFAEGGNIKSGKDRHENEKGVHQESHSYGNTSSSHAGSAVRSGAYDKGMGKTHGNRLKSGIHEEHKKVLAESRAMPKPNLPMYEGGAVEEDDRMLNQHGEIEEGPQGGGEGFHEESYMGNPGNAHDEYQSEAHMEDMVGRIMKQRQQQFSEGGRVANEDHGPNNSRLAGFSPNEFDDLSLRDDLEFSYTGANSGDELGNEQEDHDRHDIVSRIMKSRNKKDRLPNPR